LFWLVLVCAVAVGCTGLNPHVDPLPRALPVALDEVPPATIDGFRRYYPEVENPSVERCVNEKRGYRFNLPSGGWVSFDKDGNRLGGVY
jgi:hypothetical protein